MSIFLFLRLRFYIYEEKCNNNSRKIKGFIKINFLWQSMYDNIIWRLVVCERIILFSIM